jgi:GntR family transcriptional regulator, transcriptional repressor for pyruvate dehydrogenase complex
MNAKPMARSKLTVLDRLAADLAPIQFENLTEQLVRRMKAWVVRGLIKPGERLPPERELAGMLNVSRASLRQALKVLQVMGVLDLRQGSGNYLTRDAVNILNQPTDLLIPLKGLSFGELFEARRAIECEAAACAALRASPADLERMRRELEQMRQHLANPVVYFRHDVAFHRAIALASGNSVFIWFVELVSKVLGEAWLARAKEGRQDQTFPEHQAIFAAIESRNPEQARQALQHHLELAKFYTEERTAVELRVLSSQADTQ